MLFGLFAAVSAAFSATHWKVQCSSTGGAVSASYCIHRPTGSPNADVLYYLHGAGGSEQTWAEPSFFTRQLREAWDARELVRPPTVVSVSYGTVWLLAERNTSPRSGLLNHFTEIVLPQIERLLGKGRGQRLLLGDSMGGFNALQLGLKTGLFARVAALCAPVSTLTPFASDAEIEEQIRQSRAWSYFGDAYDNLVRSSVRRAIEIARVFYPTPEAWATADPIRLVSRGRKPGAFYLAVGFYDEYANYEGNEQIARALKLRGIGDVVQWRPQWGGHCAIDIPSLADWITPE